MSREAWGDPPDREPELCPHCDSAQHLDGCELYAEVKRRLAAEARIAELTAEVERLRPAYCHSQQQFVDAAAEVERLRAGG